MARRYGSGTFMVGFARYDAVGRPLMPGIMVGVLIVETVPLVRLSVGRCCARCCAATGAVRHFPAVLGDSGRCLNFCSSPTWWSSLL